MLKGALTFLLCASAPVVALSYAHPRGPAVIGFDVGQTLRITGEEVFENSPILCETNNTCDLKKIIFRKENYVLSADPRIKNDGTIVSTRILAGIVTKEIEDLTNYVWVQYTRGCMWYSFLNEKMELDSEFGVVRDYLGISRIQHVFPRWVIDSEDTDPAYASDALSGDRFYYLQSQKKIPPGIPDRQGALFGEKPPTIPFAYVTDNPGPASYNPALQIASNMSLEFRMCLFRATDVPTDTDGTTPGTEKSIKCFDWDGKFVFDHVTKVFKNPPDIAEECNRPFNAREKNYHLHQLERSGEEISDKE